MSQLDQLLSFNYSGLGLSLRSYELEETPIVERDLGRTGTSVLITCHCELVCASPVALEEGLAAVYGVLAANGQALIIAAIGGVEELVLTPGQCKSGGPHIRFDVKDGPGPCSKLIEVKILAEVANSSPTNSYKVKMDTRPDGLMVVTQSGIVAGVGAQAFFVSSVLPAAQAAYAWPDWVLKSSYDAGITYPLADVKYTITAAQNVSPLPASDDGDSEAVDGTASKRVDIDEQGRRVTTYEFSLLISGDPVAVATAVRPTDVVIARESMQITSIKQTQLTASFTVIDSADPDQSPLVSFTQTVAIEGDDDTYEIKTYPGADPVLCQAPMTVQRITQSGSATAIGAYLVAPDNIFPALLRPPEQSYIEVNQIERQTTWSYAMTPDPPGPDDDGIGDYTPAMLVGQIARASLDPTFIDDDPTSAEDFS